MSIDRSGISVKRSIDNLIWTAFREKGVLYPYKRWAVRQVIWRIWNRIVLYHMILKYEYNVLKIKLKIKL